MSFSFFYFKASKIKLAEDFKSKVTEKRGEKNDSREQVGKVQRQIFRQGLLYSGTNLNPLGDEELAIFCQ